MFIDALEPREYSGVFNRTEMGLVDSGYPRVTPKVTGEVYSGLSPSQQGMGRVHSFTGNTPTRPEALLMQERLEREGYDVLSLNMPYCAPLNLQNQAWVSTAQGDKAAGENPFAQSAEIPPVNANLVEDNKDEAYNIKQEAVIARISNALLALESGGFDVLFLGIREPDQYTHFQWNEPYRKNIIEVLSSEIERMSVNHDVFWWSDHGSEEKKDVFRINKWLMEKGFLNLDIDLEFNEKFNDEMEDRNPQHANMGMDIENQLSISSPGVDMRSSSQVVSADPYDASINILDSSVDLQELTSELVSTKYISRCVTPEEVWGDGSFIEECADLIPIREDNTLVTGNVHPEPIGMGFYRTGVHSDTGAWGATDDLGIGYSGSVHPRQLHDVIFEWITGTDIDMASIDDPNTASPLDSS